MRVIKREKSEQVPSVKELEIGDLFYLIDEIYGTTRNDIFMVVEDKHGIIIEPHRHHTIAINMSLSYLTSLNDQTKVRRTSGYLQEENI